MFIASRPAHAVVITMSLLLMAGSAWTQDNPNRPPWAQKRKTNPAPNPTGSGSSTSSTTSGPDGEPGKIVQPTPGDSPAGAAGGSQAGKIVRDVNLVTVLASVLDEKNRPAPDLPKEAFHIYEEGVEQKVEIFEPETSKPLDLALMIDTSKRTITEITL